MSKAAFFLVAAMVAVPVALVAWPSPRARSKAPAREARVDAKEVAKSSISIAPASSRPKSASVVEATHRAVSGTANAGAGDAHDERRDEGASESRGGGPETDGLDGPDAFTALDTSAPVASSSRDGRSDVDERSVEARSESSASAAVHAAADVGALHGDSRADDAPASAVAVGDAPATAIAVEGAPAAEVAVVESSAHAQGETGTSNPDVEPTTAQDSTASAADAPAEASDAADEPHGLTGDWDGARSRLADQGIEIAGSLIFDTHRIAEGGIERRTVGHTLVDVNASFDLAKLAGWDDALVVADAYFANGRNPSASAGDYQSFSNISVSRNYAQLAQLYLEKSFFDQRLRLKLGKADANADFAAPDHCGAFLNSAAAWSPSMFPFPSYPNPATCIVMSGQLTESWTLAAGVYDGAGNTGLRTGGHGPGSFFGDPSDTFYIGELGHTWTLGDDELAGHCALGAWWHTGNFDAFSGGVDDGTNGHYAFVDQELARLGAADEPGTLSAFVQWGGADDDVAPVDAHYALGVVAEGVGAGRPDDAFGCYWSRVRFSEGAGLSAPAETAFELFYSWRCADWCTLKPDVQTIANPGGDATLDDALVFTLRVQIDF